VKLQNLQSKERAGLEDEVLGFAKQIVWKNDEKNHGKPRQIHWWIIIFESRNCILVEQPFESEYGI
jgi:hypothetical protein